MGVFLRTIELKIEINNSRKHIGSKNLPLFQSLMYAIYLLNELWYPATLWGWPDGGSRNAGAAQRLTVLQVINMIMKGNYVVHKN